ncbi:MAG: signal recognition particle subunit SRP19/SEC65 family protein [Methanoregula sp.]|nr:signal recognition particle subunit SRP19/SEC65 family protein [Methanoregula sp.]
MVKGTKGECILYPCYFNASLSRKAGRRVSIPLGAKGPVLSDIERALKRSNVKFRVEVHHHPAHWARREGRVIAEWHESKEALIKKVAHKLEVKR